MNKLAVLWANADREVALRLVFAYCIDAKVQGWWNEIRLVVWGPSAKTLSEDAGLQEELKRVKNTGVVLEACKTVADFYNVSENLERLGFNVRLMGLTLTQMIKGDYKVLTI